MRRLRVMQPPVAPIWIDRREEIKDVGIELVRHFFEPTVLVAEVPRGVGDDLSALDFIPMNIAVDIQARLALWIAYFLGRYFKTP